MRDITYVSDNISDTDSSLILILSILKIVIAKLMRISQILLQIVMNLKIDFIFKMFNSGAKLM